MSETTLTYRASQVAATRRGVIDANGSLQVTPLDAAGNPSGGGTQYTEGDTDATVTGVAMVFEADTGTNTLRTPSTTYPLPVQQAALSEGVDLAMGPPITITTVAVSLNTTTTLVTPTSGKRLHVYHVRYSHADATGTLASIQRSTTGATLYASEWLEGKGQPGGPTFKPTYLELAVDEVLQAKLSVASSVYYTAFTREV